MLDTLIVNGTIIDGSGAPARNGNIGMKDGKIVSCSGNESAIQVIDARNRVVCPGFIDAHSHGDRLLGTEDGRLFKTPQHKMLGKDNWGRQKETLALIQEANNEGIYTTCDQYPYTRNMTRLSACIPNWHLSDGNAALTERLRDRAFRERLKSEMENPATPYDNYYRNAGGWDGVYISSAPKTPEVAGQFVSEYAEKIGKDPWETYFDLMMENECNMGGVFCSMCEEDICEIIRSPYCVVGTDGCTISWKHKGHPRASATFPHAINYYVKEKKILTLEQMIHKMTGLTAERLLVPNKGLLRAGYDADVLIIDYNNLKDLATYDAPNRLTEGMDYVIVNGEIVYNNMKFTGNYSGTFVRHTGGKSC